MSTDASLRDAPSSRCSGQDGLEGRGREGGGMGVEGEGGWRDGVEGEGGCAGGKEEEGGDMEGLALSLSLAPAPSCPEQLLFFQCRPPLVLNKGVLGGENGGGGGGGGMEEGRGRGAHSCFLWRLPPVAPNSSYSSSCFHPRC